MADNGMSLVVGLGNPGPKYELTRHNVGYWFVDCLAARNGGSFRLENRFHGFLCRVAVAGRDLRLLKPATFMNRSGQSLSAVVRYYDIPTDRILVVHDELDLPVGTLRLKRRGGHAGHNGLRDIINVLGTQDFWRLRVGIDHPEDRTQVVNYVLSRPTKDEAASIHDALDEARACMEYVICGDLQKAMNRLHSLR